MKKKYAEKRLARRESRNQVFQLREHCKPGLVAQCILIAIQDEYIFPNEWEEIKNLVDKGISNLRKT